MKDPKNEPVKLDFSTIWGSAENCPEGSQNATESGRINYTPNTQNAAQNGSTNATEAAGEGGGAEWMVKAYAQEQADHEKALTVYREYQENIRRAGSLKADILKGSKDGEPLEDLLLKAVKCISLMTADDLFAKLIEKDLEARAADPDRR